jgi:hypothetical protein
LILNWCFVGKLQQLSAHFIQCIYRQVNWMCNTPFYTLSGSLCLCCVEWTQS